jgi:hypothetical protein
VAQHHTPPYAAALPSTMRLTVMGDSPVAALISRSDAPFSYALRMAAARPAWRCSNSWAAYRATRSASRFRFSGGMGTAPDWLDLVMGGL